MGWASSGPVEVDFLVGAHWTLSCAQYLVVAQLTAE